MDIEGWLYYSYFGMWILKVKRRWKESSNGCARVERGWTCGLCGRHEDAALVDQGLMYRTDEFRCAAAAPLKQPLGDLTTEIPTAAKRKETVCFPFHGLAEVIDLKVWCFGELTAVAGKCR